MSVEDTLAERGKTHGNFEDMANTTQFFKDEMRGYDNWNKLDQDQREALDMIVHKISRILNGDPNHADTWHDIAGYAKLVDDRLSRA